MVLKPSVSAPRLQHQPNSSECPGPGHAWAQGERGVPTAAAAGVDPPSTQHIKQSVACPAPRPQEESDILKIVRMVAARNYHPCIVFNFSKKECEALTQQARAPGRRRPRVPLPASATPAAAAPGGAPAATRVRGGGAAGAAPCCHAYVHICRRSARGQHSTPAAAGGARLKAAPPAADVVAAHVCLPPPCHPPQMLSLDLNEEDEKKLVDGIFSSAVDCLSGARLLW